MQSSVWFPEDPARKALVQRWAIAFVWCAMDHVREDCDLEPHLQVGPVHRSICTSLMCTSTSLTLRCSCHEMLQSFVTGFLML